MYFLQSSQIFLAVVQLASTVYSATIVPQAAVSGYNLAWTNPNAAADGAGFITAFVSGLSSYDELTSECASACSKTTTCKFFNVYQELASSPVHNICALWSQAKPSTSATNTYNLGRPISNSAGYLLAGTGTDAATLPGYVQYWTSSNAAADGPGYLKSFISQSSTTYAQLLVECAASCTASNNCAFFNAYQEIKSTPIHNICVLWSRVKSAATNTYNRGRPISNSIGYAKLPLSSTSGMVTSTTSRPATTTSAAPQEVEVTMSSSSDTTTTSTMPASTSVSLSADNSPPFN